MQQITEKWKYNQVLNKYEKTSEELMSVFPTIVEPKQKIAFCRKCHRWEYIVRFHQNQLMTQCGNVYYGPFALENSLFNYGFLVDKNDSSYKINVKFQSVVIRNHRFFENRFFLDLNKRILYKNDKMIFESEEMANSICLELVEEILDDMGSRYKALYGIKPTVSSKLKGFHVIVGYMLAPFNINFYKIAQHWGLNPYDSDFRSLSSGDTPTAENEMFASLGIKPTKTIRKMYQQNPQYVVCYAATNDMGFTDVNILQKSYSPEYYDFLCYLMISFAGGLVSYANQDNIKNYVEDLLKISDQKTVWNSIQRTVKYYQKNKNYSFNINDGFGAYSMCRNELSDNEKKEIMREGFNDYTHDFLIRRIDDMHINADGLSHGNTVNNIIFDIEDSFLALEYKAGDDKKKIKNVHTGLEEIVPCPDEERYCFYVARDSKTLRTIGSEMHNCVGWGYANSVEQRKATIVYAMYQNKYKICIEVTPNFGIRQALGPCNYALCGKDLEAYSEWCHEKNIQFTKAFGVHCAP